MECRHHSFDVVHGVEVANLRLSLLMSFVPTLDQRQVARVIQMRQSTLSFNRLQGLLMLFMKCRRAHQNELFTEDFDFLNLLHKLWRDGIIGDGEVEFKFTYVLYQPA